MRRKTETPTNHACGGFVRFPFNVTSQRSVVPLSAAPIAVDSHAFYGLGKRIAVCRISFPDSPPPRRTKYVVDQEKLTVPALHATLPNT